VRSRRAHAICWVVGRFLDLEPYSLDSCIGEVGAWVVEAVIYSRGIKIALRAMSRPAGVAARRSFATTRVARMTPEEDAFFTELAGDLHGHDTKGALEALRRQIRGIDALQAQINTPLKKIDWAHYRSVIGRPGVVDDAQSGLEAALAEIEKSDFLSFKEGDVDVPALLKESDAKFAAIIKDAEAMKVSSIEAKKGLEAELAKCKAERAAIAEMTVAEELKNNPEIAKQIEDEIDNNKWFVL